MRFQVKGFKLLKINKIADYASVILVNLSHATAVSQSASDISGRTQIAHPTVSKILKLLNDAGLVVSQRGVNGGYLLARDPGAITLAQVMAAVDNSACLTGCSGTTPNCEIKNSCVVSENWQLINQVVQSLFESVTVADLGGDLTLRSLVDKLKPVMVN